MSASEPQYLLKILTGPHLGAEVELPAGAYRFGHGAECDIVIADRTVAEEHATFTLGPAGVDITAASGPVTIEGEAVPEGRTIPFFTVLALGTTRIAFGPLDQEWPELDPAAAARTDGQARWSRFKETEPAHVPYLEDLSAAPVPPFWQRPKVRLARAAVIGIAIALAVGVPLRLYMGNATAVSTDVEAEAPVDERLATVLAELGIRDQVTVRTQGQRLVIDGYLPDAASRTELVRRLSEDGIDAQLRVFTDEQIETAARQTLVALGSDLEPQAIGNGTLVLTGFVEDPERLERIVEILERDVGGLRELQPQIETRATAAQALIRELEAHGLDGVVRLRRERDGSILAEGVVSADQQADWDKVKAWFTSTFGDRVALVSRVGEAQVATPVARPPEGIDITLRAVGHRPMPYIILADGQKYLVGSVLEDGVVIEAIGDGTILFSRDGRTFEYRYGPGGAS
jgi:type III secretion system YscD/HrpQ family protein